MNFVMKLYCIQNHGLNTHTRALNNKPLIVAKLLIFCAWLGSLSFSIFTNFQDAFSVAFIVQRSLLIATLNLNQKVIHKKFLINIFFLNFIFN